MPLFKTASNTVVVNFEHLLSTIKEQDDAINSNHAQASLQLHQISRLRWISLDEKAIISEEIYPQLQNYFNDVAKTEHMEFVWINFSALGETLFNELCKKLEINYSLTSIAFRNTDLSQLTHKQILSVCEFLFLHPQLKILEFKVASLARLDQKSFDCLMNTFCFMPNLESIQIVDMLSTENKKLLIEKLKEHRSTTRSLKININGDNANILSTSSLVLPKMMEEEISKPPSKKNLDLWKSYRNNLIKLHAHINTLVIEPLKSSFQNKIITLLNKTATTISERCKEDTAAAMLEGIRYHQPTQENQKQRFEYFQFLMFSQMEVDWSNKYTQEKMRQQFYCAGIFPFLYPLTKTLVLPTDANDLRVIDNLLGRLCNHYELSFTFSPFTFGSFTTLTTLERTDLLIKGFMMYIEGIIKNTETSEINTNSFHSLSPSSIKKTEKEFQLIFENFKKLPTSEARFAQFHTFIEFLEQKIQESNKKETSDFLTEKKILEWLGWLACAEALINYGSFMEGMSPTPPGAIITRTNSAEILGRKSF